MPVAPSLHTPRHVVDVVLLFLLLPAYVQPKLYMQPYRLQELFYREETVVSVFQVAADLDPNLKEVAKYLDRVSHRVKELPVLVDLTNENEHLEQIMEVLVGNPLHVYSLVNRFVHHLQQARQELANHPKYGGLERAVFAVLRRGEYPTQADLDGVTLAVSRVQFTYRLNPVDMAQGKILGVQTHGYLDSSDLLNVAMRRYSGQTPIRPGVYQEYALAYEWAEAALELVRKEEGSSTNRQMEEVINNFLTTVKTQHNQLWRPTSDSPGNLPNEEFFIDRIGAQSGRNLREVESKTLAYQYLPNRDFESSYYLHDFYALCRGEPVNVNRSRALEQRCYYDDLDDPYFLIGPLKLEVLSEFPPVLVYHEILAPSDLASMKLHVAAQLNAAEIQDVTKVDGSGAKVTTERTQSSGWLWDYQLPFLYTLSNRLDKITKLNVARADNEPYTNIVESEAWQIGVYGPGGHYLPHYDAFEVLDPSAYTPDGVWVGNRISTVMFYLSDVVGGATAFPKVGVAARPRAGSMVYWHNLHTDGARDNMSLHGACPTALGIKWVSNKWIREGAQIWNRPCTNKV